MFDDSKRLDYIENWMGESKKNIEEIIRRMLEFDKGANKNFQTINKNVSIFETKFTDIRKRLETLEKTVTALEAKLKKIK